MAIAVHRLDGVADHVVNAADTALEVRVRGVHAGIDEGHVDPLALADALRECGIDFGKTPLELHVGIVVAHALGLPGVQRILVQWFGNRSEEHTYELQSLMRISYAVLCLKKQKDTLPQYYSNDQQ